MKVFISALAGFLMAGSVLAQVIDFGSLRAKCGAIKAKIEADCGKAKEIAKVGYGNALAAAMASYKKGGNLDAYLAADKAKKQFDVDGKVPEEGGVDLTGAVRAYWDAVKKADSDVLAKTYSLNLNYAAQLEPLIRQLMQADKIDEAKWVKDELERVKFELADTESKQPKTQGTNGVEGATDTGDEKATGFSGRKIVIWNGNNGGNAGTLVFDIVLSSVGKSVWEKKGVEIKWKPTGDSSLTLDLPMGLRFDKVHLDITKWQGVAACLAEIQVFDSMKKNIAEHCEATASGYYNESNGSFPPDLLTDGITSSETRRKGYWHGPVGQASWIELDLTKKTSNKGKK